MSLGRRMFVFASRAEAVYRRQAVGGLPARLSPGASCPNSGRGRTDHDR
jgi:hypothetical protein